MRLRAEYLEANPYCQLSLVVDGRATFPDHFGGRLCVHHICGRGKGAETWANYATVAPDAHEWAHGDCSVQARICLLWFKWQLSQRVDLRHWDQDALQQVFGKRPVGWVEARLFSETECLPRWVREMGRELVEQ